MLNGYPFKGNGTPLDERGFDSWSNTYDLDVNASEEKSEYPFEAYSDVISGIVRLIKTHPGDKILDCGIGTGALSKILYDIGYNISGIDFSQKMLGICKDSMPLAKLIQHDFSQAGLPAGLSFYDAIVFAYSIHHLSFDLQLELIKCLAEHLNPGGIILIGDVMTSSQAAMQKLADKYDELWDDTEFYPIVDVYSLGLPEFELQHFLKSESSGIILLSKIAKQGRYE